MLQINLLPKKFQAKLRSKRIRGALIEASIFSIIIIIVVIVGILLVNGVLTMINNNLDEQVQNEEKKIQEFAKLEEEIKAYKENSNLYDEVLKNQYNWSEILIHITELTPSDLQVTQLSIKEIQEGEGKIVDFSGKALSRREVAKFVKKLEDSERLEEIELSSSSLDQEGRADFQITAKLIK